MATYTTVQGDVLDFIVTAHYGDIDGALEAVLSVNPGLLVYGPVLPAGVSVNLPEIEAPAGSQAEILNIWQ